jgi:hypothetical protein
LANRKLRSPSTTAGVISGPDFMEDAADEVANLWRYVNVPLSNVAGTANAITADCDVPLQQYQKGPKFSFLPAAVNASGGVTININGLGNRSILNRDGSPPVAGRLQIGRLEHLEDTGTALRLITDQALTTTRSNQALWVYQKAAGQESDAAVAGWNTYKLNTEVHNTIAGCSFTAGTNSFILPTGFYDITAEITTYLNRSGLYLWDGTTNLPVTTGMATRRGWQQQGMSLTGRIEVAASRSFSLRVFSENAVGATAFGYSANITTPVSLPEQYGYLKVDQYP